MICVLSIIHFNANVLASDGEILKVYVWLPDSAVSGPDTLPLPVILVRTPYDTIGLSSSYIPIITSSGYAYVVSTFRGYWGSTGIRLPFLAEGWGTLHDGLDVANWISSKPWFNGKMCMAGGSALGFSQYFLGGTGFPLTCISPAVAGISLYNEVYPGGVMRRFIAEYWLTRVGATHLLDTIEKYYIYSDTTPWAWVNGYNRLSYYTFPVLHLTGWFDAFTEGAIGGFLALQYYGGVGARGKQHILIGPWMHDLSSRTVGDLTFPPNANSLSATDFTFNWILYHTKGLGWNWDTIPPVIFYLMGDVYSPDTTLFNRWVKTDTFPPRGGYTTNLYLHGNGRLLPSTPTPDTLTYAYDPNNPVPTIGGFDYIGGSIRDSILFGPRDLTPWEGRGDVLVFSSDTLSEPLIVIGSPEVELLVSSDRYDTDFMVFLADYYPSTGKSILITEGVLRMRNRNGTDREELLTPGDTYRIRIKMRNTAYAFNTGHVLKLYITSSKFPSYEPNPNTGAPFQIDDPVRLVATNSIYIGNSRLILPTYGPSVLVEERKPRPYCYAYLSGIRCSGAKVLRVYDVRGRVVDVKGVRRGVHFVKTTRGILKVMVR